MDTSLALRRLAIRRASGDALFDRALAGDPVAFSEVYRRYQKRVYGFCLARLMDPDAAADAAQEVFLRILAGSTEHVDSPLAWIFAVARSVTLDAMRKDRRTPAVDELDPETTGSTVAAADTAAEILGREDARNVFLALRRLRPRYRTALILREFHHQTSVDIAEALGSTTGAVDTLVSRARDAFGQTYAEVAGLPEACRTSVAAIYQRQGTGLDDAQAARLDSHLSTCPRCRSEAAKAARPEQLAALLPFLVPGKGLNIFERAVLAIRGLGDTAARVSTVLPAEQWTPAGKIAAGAVAAVLIAAPIAATVHPGSTPAAHAVTAAVVRPAAKTTAKAGPPAASWWCYAPTSTQTRNEQMQYEKWRSEQCMPSSTTQSSSSPYRWTSAPKSSSWAGTSGSGSWSGSSTGGSRTSRSGSRSGSWSGASSGSRGSSSGSSSRSWSGSGGSRSYGSWSGSSRW